MASSMTAGCGTCATGSTVRMMHVAVAVLSTAVCDTAVLLVCSAFGASTALS